MAATRLNESTLRPSDLFLVWAFTLSLAAHLAVYGGFELGHRLGWWKKDLMPTWLRSTKQQLAELKKKQPPPPQLAMDVPQLFLEVDPSVAVQEAPKNAKYYSSQNSRAANPNEVTIDTQQAKVDGSQTHVPTTQSARLNNPTPLQPAPPKPPPDSKEADADAKPKPKGKPIGDLAMAKPDPKPDDGQTDNSNGDAAVLTHKRPHTIDEARAQHQIPGQAMKQDGGVERHLHVATLDAQATPLGLYDRRIVDAVTSQWWNLLDSKQFSRDRTGQVTVQFKLLPSGRIEDLRVIDQNVGDLLTYVCESAIRDTAPYDPWPSDLRRFLGTDEREVTFVFYYE